MEYLDLQQCSRVAFVNSAPAQCREASAVTVHCIVGVTAKGGATMVFEATEYNLYDVLRRARTPTPAPATVLPETLIHSVSAHSNARTSDHCTA